METREEHYASMMQAVQRYAPSADLEEIQKAYEYANKQLYYFTENDKGKTTFSRGIYSCGSADSNRIFKL